MKTYQSRYLRLFSNGNFNKDVQVWISFGVFMQSMMLMSLIIEGMYYSVIPCYFATAIFADFQTFIPHRKIKTNRNFSSLEIG